jgi:riboflavin kinase/FMN adenylyltransferase
MRVFDLSQPVPQDARNAVVAIGNFDALHRGHHALLEVARKRALDVGRPFGVLTFEPHPRRLFRPDDAPFRVTPASVKLQRLEISKADCVYVLDFSWDVAHLSAEDFIQKILHEQLGTKNLVVGADFHFGQNRAGTIDLLQSSGFHCTILDQIKDAQNGVYSATRIRGLIQSGHIDEANALLGWDWEIQGIVQHGDKRGREIGYPTANVPLGDTIHPAYGVYAAQVKIPGEKEWRVAAVNIGIRPMFETPVALLEAYIFDYSGDLYDQTLRIRPVKKIRDEEKFGSIDALKTQIAKDCDETRKILLHKAC